jgi:hypothetical protein
MIVFPAIISRAAWAAPTAWTADEFSGRGRLKLAVVCRRLVVHAAIGRHADNGAVSFLAQIAQVGSSL